MKVLLDTHLALWLLNNDRRISKDLRAMALDPANELCVSAVSIWEIAIKHALNRGLPDDMPIGADKALRAFREAGFTLIDIQPEHAAAVAALPTIHGDPFDRLLVAQALTDELTLWTRDSKVAAYAGTIRLV